MVNGKPNVEDAFMNYLASQVSPAQLSELYLCYGEIDSFFRKAGVLEEPLFETTDIKKIKKLRQAIERNQAFHNRHKKDLWKFVKAVRHYSDFLRVGYRPQSEQDKKLANKIENPKSSALAVPTFAQESPDPPGVYTVDFNGNNDVAFTTPIQFSYFDDVKTGFSSWKELYVAVIAELCEDYPKNFHPGMRFSQSSRRVDLSKHRSESMISPIPVPGTDYILETNYSASNMITKMKYLLDLCLVDYENVVITYRKKDSAPQSQRQKTSAVPVFMQEQEEILKRKIKADLSIDVEKFLRSNGLSGVTVQQVIEKVRPGMGVLPMKRLLDENPNVIAMPKDRYLHSDAFVDLEDAEEGMMRILRRHFARFGGYSNRKLLYGAAQQELSMFLNDNDCDDMESIYALARYFFVKRRDKDPFVFCHPHIFEHQPDEPTNLKGLMIRLARQNDGILIGSEAEEFLNQTLLSHGNLNQVVQIGSSDTFLQYDGERYLLSDTIGIDDAWKQTMHNRMDGLFREANVAYVIPRDIRRSWLKTLPKLPNNLEWTILLLQDVLHKFPDIGFRSVIADSSQTYDTIAAAIVPAQSDLQTFPDVVALFMSERHKLPQRLSKEELRIELRDAGMLQGNELIYTMQKVLNDYRFSWTDNDQTVLVRKT